MPTGMCHGRFSAGTGISARQPPLTETGPDRALGRLGDDEELTRWFEPLVAYI